MAIRIARIYDDHGTGGYRVLVDRVWPRGISKAQAALDEWLKAVAPSTELRRWFGHDPQKYEEFRSRYREELASNPAMEELRHIVTEHQDVVLLYGAKDTEHNQAVVLAELLR